MALFRPRRAPVDRGEVGRSASTTPAAAPAPTAQVLLRDGLRDVVGPLLRQHGYRGSAPTWTLMSPRGDVAVINVQSSSSSTSAEVRCWLNIAVAPEPWLDWQSRHRSTARAAVKEHDGMFRDRLLHTVLDEPADWWHVVDRESAARVTRQMCVRLEEEGLPRLEHLLERRSILDVVREGRLSGLGSAGAGVALVVLLADEGPSAELTRAVEALTSRRDLSSTPTADALAAWAVERARLHRAP